MTMPQGLHVEFWRVFALLKGKIGNLLLTDDVINIKTSELI